jgi:hypothetical protein
MARATSKKAATAEYDSLVFVILRVKLSLIVNAETY